MARVAVALSCTTEIMAELERLFRSPSGAVRMAERARTVLACLRDQRNDEVVSEMGLRPNTVGLRPRRFAQRGIAGLRHGASAPTSNAPPSMCSPPLTTRTPRHSFGANERRGAPSFATLSLIYAIKYL